MGNLKKRNRKDLLQGISDDDYIDVNIAARLSTAQSTIKKTQEDLSYEVDAKEIDRQLIADRLRKAAIEAKGLRAFQPLADMYTGEMELAQVLRSEHRKHPVTCLQQGLVPGDGQVLLFTGDKGGVVIKWRFENTSCWRKQHVFRVESGVNALALSSDCKYLVIGTTKGQLHVFDGTKNRKLGKLGPNEHRASVLAIAFQSCTYQLYSSSADRTVKLWNVEQLAYMDTLFGHQDSVYGVCAIPGVERCVTVGGRDRTLRIWKILEESQLILRLSETDGGSLDEVQVCSEQEDKAVFVTGSDKGILSIWSASRKKPLRSIVGHNGPILALHSPEKSNLLISGSSDGTVKLWKLQDEHLNLVNELPIPGHITSFAVCKDLLIIGVGPEGKFGRWTVQKEIKPSVLVFKLANKL